VLVACANEMASPFRVPDELTVSLPADVHAAQMKESVNPALFIDKKLRRQLNSALLDGVRSFWGV